MPALPRNPNWELTTKVIKQDISHPLRPDP